jgi:hypothetical protein
VQEPGRLACGKDIPCRAPNDPFDSRTSGASDGWTADHLAVRQSAVFDTSRADHDLRRRQAELEDVKRGLRVPPAPEKKTFGDALEYWIENRAAEAFYILGGDLPCPDGTVTADLPSNAKVTGSE